MNADLPPQNQAPPEIRLGPSPQQPDEDPYFSVDANVTAGPLSAPTTANPNGEPPFARLPDQPMVETPRTSIETELSDEADIRGYQDDQTDEALGDQPMPIRCVPSNLVPKKNQTVASRSQTAACPKRNETVIEQNAEGEFLAGNGNVVEIDGNEGYDYIDLSDRSIADLSFHDSSITVLDADESQSFTIRYQNVGKAMLAGGQIIQLP